MYLYAWQLFCLLHAVVGILRNLVLRAPLALGPQRRQILGSAKFQRQAPELESSYSSSDGKHEDSSDPPWLMR